MISMTPQTKKIIPVLLLILCCLPQPLLALGIMLPQVYSEELDVIDWLMSEKLDGVRGYWDGEKMLSKNGHPLYPPAAFTKNLPPFPLEGELWGGRNTFLQTAAIVKKKQPHNGWLQLKFAIFDLPLAEGGFRQRLKKAEEWFALKPNPYTFIIPQIVIHSKGQLQAELERVEKLGGEGLMVRKADGHYARGRSSEILKVKSFFDEEAVVIAHINGKGRNQDRLGSLLVELADKTQFKIGSGFSDIERDNPPPIGTTITFKYYGFYPSGIPKFPSYMRIRTDSSW